MRKKSVICRKDKDNPPIFLYAVNQSYSLSLGVHRFLPRFCVDIESALQFDTKIRTKRFIGDHDLGGLGLSVVDVDSALVMVILTI